MQRIKGHFYFKRNEDESGVSGTGIVAVGAILPDGQCVVQWLTFTSSVAIYKNIDAVIEIHGHHGKTEVIMGDPPDEQAVGEPPKKQRKARRNTKQSGETVS